MIPGSFAYHRPSSVKEAVGLLGKLGEDARAIAGGHSLIPMMKLRLARPEALIDINDLGELSYVRLEGDELRIGALTRHAEDGVGAMNAQLIDQDLRPAAARMCRRHLFPLARSERAKPAPYLESSIATSIPL